MSITALVWAGINFVNYRLDLLWLIAAIVELVGCMRQLCDYQEWVGTGISKVIRAKQKVPTEQ